MSHRSSKSKAPTVAAGLILAGFLLLTGCKEKSGSDASAVVQAPAESQIEQTTCPVMDGPINKELYTRYKGKKVYFCCPGCEQEFDKDPEKYIAKLPQFK